MLLLRALGRDKVVRPFKVEHFLHKFGERRSITHVLLLIQLAQSESVLTEDLRALVLEFFDLAFGHAASGFEKLVGVENPLEESFHGNTLKLLKSGQVFVKQVNHLVERTEKDGKRLAVVELNLS